MDYLEGIDVSHHNEVVDWAQVATAGMVFAFAKATEGATVTDAQFAANWSGMAAAGLIRGAYHFFHPLRPPEVQADHFLAVLGDLAAGDLPPVLDIEETSQTNDEWPKIPVDQRLGLVQSWLNRVEAACGVKPILYTRTSWLKQYLPHCEALAGYPLWLADYRKRDQPALPAAWQAWSFWQYTEGGVIAGIAQPHVDCNRFNGTIDDLRALTKPGPSPNPDPNPNPNPPA